VWQAKRRAPAAAPAGGAKAEDTLGHADAPAVHAPSVVRKSRRVFIIIRSSTPAGPLLCHNQLIRDSK